MRRFVIVQGQGQHARRLCVIMHVISVVLGVKPTVNKRHQIVAPLNGDGIPVAGGGIEAWGLAIHRHGCDHFTVVEVQNLELRSVCIEQGQTTRRVDISMLVLIIRAAATAAGRQHRCREQQHRGSDRSKAEGKLAELIRHQELLIECYNITSSASGKPVQTLHFRVATEPVGMTWIRCSAPAAHRNEIKFTNISKPECYVITYPK